MTFVFRQHLASLNRRMDRGEFVDFGQGSTIDDKNVREAIRRAAVLEGIDEDEAIQRRKGFRYLY
jgi:hypothetical protein